MYKNCLKYLLLICLLCISLSVASQPPYMISKVISQNKIAKFNNQKLLVIDFWATWCFACGPATEQMETLQATKPDEVFIVSVSDETEETISAYLQKNPIRLAVLEDYQPSSMVNLFQVKSRPYAVLLTLDGKILYKGHPSGITEKVIDKYALQQKSQPQKSWNNLFYTVKNTPSQVTLTEKDKELFITKQPQTGKTMYVENGLFQYSGPLSELIKYLLDCSDYQIEFNDMTDYGVSMHCDESELSDSKTAVLQQIAKILSFTVQSESKPMEASILNVVKPKLLWDDKQINWNNNGQPSSLIGTDHIEADNFTLKEIANLLSDVKKNLYYYDGNDIRPHDWNFQYLYNGLMMEDLLNNFGIRLDTEKIDLPIYIVSPMD